MVCYDWVTIWFGVLYSKSIIIILHDGEYHSLPVIVPVRHLNKEHSKSLEFLSYVVVNQNSKHRLNITKDAKGDIWQIDVKVSSRLLGLDPL